MKIALSGAFFAASIGSALALLAKRNRETYATDLLEMRDTSRPSYKSYGLNFGFKTDSAIEERLDTGDILLLQYDCLQEFSVSSKLL